MKIAVITGASSGLGKEYALAVKNARRDIDEIWVIARRKERLEQLAGQIPNLRVLALDITSDDSIAEYAALLKETGAEIALLINNAGFGKLGSFDALATAENAGMVRLNCEALTVMTSVSLSCMRRGAEIINTCSIAAFAPNTRMAVYCSTKAYVMSLSRALRVELRERGINVLAVCPGPMDTEFLTVANIPRGASRTFDTLPRVRADVMAKKSLSASAKGKSVYTNLVFFKFYRVIAKLLPHSIVMKLCGA